MKHNKHFHLRIQNEEDGSTTLLFRILTCLLIILTIAILYIGSQRYRSTIDQNKTSYINSSGESLPRGTINFDI